MTKNFNSKKFQGRARIYRPVPGAPNVNRLYVWQEIKQEYLPPTQGCPYEARRWEVQSAARARRVKRSFFTLEEARAWQRGAPEIQASQGLSVSVPKGPLFGAIADEWKLRTYPKLAETTRIAYSKLTGLHLRTLSTVPIYDLTPQRVDQWLDELKAPFLNGAPIGRRQSFSHELELLSGILKYYGEYYDDPQFRFPIKDRHWEGIKLNVPKKAAPKDLTEQEFQLFRNELAKRKHGEMLAPLATLQFYQALRISEAAGLHHEDLRLDLGTPKLSRLKVVRCVCWPRSKGMPSFVKVGFKNAGSNQGVKEHPLFPASFRSIEALTGAGMKGLLFHRDGHHFEYREIQFAYDEAFKAAGLPYRGTHVLRHGGCRFLYNETGDLSIAQQHLGNSDVASVQVYAKRQASALTRIAHSHWDRETLVASGRNDGIEETK